MNLLRDSHDVSVAKEATMSDSQQPAERPQETPPLYELQRGQRVWKSEDLLGDKSEALIVHHDQVYRLRCTRQGKLILYK